MDLLQQHYSGLSVNIAITIPALNYTYLYPNKSIIFISCNLNLDLNIIIELALEHNDFVNPDPVTIQL